MPSSQLLSRLAARVRPLVVVALLLACAHGAGPARAQEPADAQVKTAFLYNFARFVEWPAERFALKESPIEICTVGRDGLGSTLDSLAAKTAQGRGIKVRRGLTPADLTTCHVAFVSETEDRRLSSVQRVAREAAVLVVGESEGFAEAGGMIALVPVERKIQFDVNLATARAAGLKIPSQVLRLARSVIQGGSR